MITVSLISPLLFIFVMLVAGVEETKEYIRLPLLMVDANSGKPSENTSTLHHVRFLLPPESTSQLSVGESRSVGDGKWVSAVDAVSGEEEGSGGGDEGVNDKQSKTGSDDEEEFDEVDLIQFVEDLEHQADAEEQSDSLSDILSDIFGKDGVSITTSKSINTKQVEIIGRGNGTEKSTIILNADGDLELPSEDLSPFSDEIVEGITAGIEESLRMSDDLEIDTENNATFAGNTSETRQFSVYLFQGQYYAEPRLNRFIDGALRNMGTELRVATMDPLYFRVLPQGQVAERDQPLMGMGTSGGIRRRRPAGSVGVGRGMGNIVKRQLGAFFRPKKQAVRAGVNKKKINQVTRVTNQGGNSLFLKRRRQQQRLQQQRKRLQRLRQKKLQQMRKKKLQQQKNKNNKKKQQQLLQRIRRRIRQDVGGGRIEGLSRVQRDGDAEMQLFGNYTLIRSHMKMGPVEITMQFRTKNGIRRSGATLPVIRAHTVARVNHEGSEMIDFLLDRPHPETIRVRGTLFPLAQRIAKNIFARLFLPNSFLTHKLREKTGLAFLSKPVGERKR